jgi:hypothetical protein
MKANQLITTLLLCLFPFPTSPLFNKKQTAATCKIEDALETKDLIQHRCNQACFIARFFVYTPKKVLSSLSPFGLKKQAW